MHKPVKYFEKAVSYAAQGAWFAFERLTGADPPPDDVTATLQELNQHVLHAIEANRPSDVLADEREDAVAQRMASRAQRLRQFIQSELASE